MGSLEVLVIECTGERLKRELLVALTSALGSSTLRIVDVIFVHKDAEGRLTRYELRELSDNELVAREMLNQTRGLLSVIEVNTFGAGVSPDCSAVLMVIEHAWTARFHQTSSFCSALGSVREHVDER
ncbi:MAG: hypothetical protein JO057_05120 [Chloroflexi bacterium]|nr:hypothetical protein [Chloroflexota bacterium]